MGEEWGAPTPFLFLCDFAGELADQVRTGRRVEFAALFSERERPPDPLDPATFDRSRLDWSEPAKPAHAAWLSSTRELLRLRAAKIAPLLVEAELAVVRSEPLGTRGLRMSWRLAGGRSLDLLANLGPDPVAAPAPAGEPLYVTHPGWSDAMPPWSVDWSLSQHE